MYPVSLFSLMGYLVDSSAVHFTSPVIRRYSMFQSRQVIVLKLQDSHFVEIVPAIHVSRILTYAPCIIDYYDEMTAWYLQYTLRSSEAF